MKQTQACLPGKEREPPAGGVRVTLQDFTAAGSPQSSLPSQLTGAPGPPLPSKCVLTSKHSHSEFPSSCALGSTLPPGLVGFLCIRKERRAARVWGGRPMAG